MKATHCVIHEPSYRVSSSALGWLYSFVHKQRTNHTETTMYPRVDYGLSRRNGWLHTRPALTFRSINLKSPDNIDVEDSG